jgi:Cu+-exporting ATPase
MEDHPTKDKTVCHHCGDECRNDHLQLNGKPFCCLGCKTVYEILQANELDAYYQIEPQAGKKQSNSKKGKYDFLDDEKIQEQLILFSDEERSSVAFSLPQIHCSACVWLLERLYKFNPAIVESKVNFLKKELSIVFDHRNLSLREVANLLQSIGYAPEISLDQIGKGKRKKRSGYDRKLIYQIGLAGFAFGNIMLLSLPEYFGIDYRIDAELSRVFNWLNLILATPVAIYSGQDYFKSAWYSLRQKRLNIDVPIALGVAVLYLRSSYEIVGQFGSGYFDSLCGLLFFLLLGRLFQQKIYHQLSFERDYRSYFPIAISRILNGSIKSVPLNKIEKGNKIMVRNGELIPVDARLLKGKASLDNSFISGESRLIEKAIGDKIFAGGRQVGEAIELEVLKPLDQSRLTALWNRYAKMNKGKMESHFSESTDKISEWFTPIILMIALITGVIHFQDGWSLVFETVTAVLIVACPCALALAAPFTFGHAIRKLGRIGCYLRDSSVMEEMSKIDHVVFDKTGTLTYKQGAKITYEGSPLNDYERGAFSAMLNQSTHPLSKALMSEFRECDPLKLDHFEEIEGKGILAVIDGKVFQLGSADWLGVDLEKEQASTVVLSFEKEILGVYSIQTTVRDGLKSSLDQLAKGYSLSVLSGDHEGSRSQFEKLFPETSELLFEQGPERKVRFIEKLQKSGKKVAMVGDGLNDSAALKSADLGISIAEDVHAFAPASDLILEGEKFTYLPGIFSYSKYTRKVVLFSFAISFLYNVIGLSFAVQGELSPVLAAILMPISSISVVGFASLAAWLRPIHSYS